MFIPSRVYTVIFNSCLRYFALAQIPTNEHILTVSESRTTATESGSLSPPSTATLAEAFATSSEAVGGDAVIFFIEPPPVNKNRRLIKRAQGGFVGGNNAVQSCTNGAAFRLDAGQLLDNGSPIYHNNEPFKEFSGQGIPPDDAITIQLPATTSAAPLSYAQLGDPYTVDGASFDLQCGT
ncbi:hypothetical protein FSHL1_012776 [Fusarium sambucinum]